MPKPPVAAQRPHSFTHHGITVEDPYAWLHDQSYPEVDDKDVLAYLEAENDYFEAVMTPHKATIDALFEEIKARQKPDDATVPVKDGAYYYQSRFAEGQQYRVYTRWTGTADPAEASDVETILDVPALAEGKDFFRLGTFSVSHDHRYLAYSTDTDGSERYTLVVKDLETGELLAERIENTRGPVVWASDNKTILYLISNEQWRPYQVRRHTLGSDVGTDPIVFEEADEGFFVGLGQTMSRKHITISTGDHVTSEVRLLASADPSAELRLVAPRRTGHEYDIEHQEERLIIRTNDQHKNFRVVTVPVDAPDEENWKTLIAGSDTHYITGMECFRDWIVLEERVEGLDRIRIMDSAGQSHFVEFPDQTYVAHINANEQYETSEVRLSYTSLVTPYTIFDYTIEPRTLTTRKVQEIPSGYDAAAYTTQRRMAKARDGVEVPVSIVYRKDTPLDGTAPLYLYGYGAYGSAMSPSFGTSRLSLLDRGFVYAIAHIRGGDELGYQWYEDGKLDKRTNTFNDFVDVARFLIDEKFTRSGRIAIAGGSAGGELMGAVVNQAPELWGAVAAHVPFVDVLNTMLDDSLPLTPLEWPEWGNPIEDKAAFEYIRSYSPYDQLKRAAYPPMLVTAGLNDPRVTYWEPAKYVAKLRTLKTDDNPLVLKTNMGAGHGGKSGRFDSLYEVAEEYAFILSAFE